MPIVASTIGTMKAEPTYSVSAAAAETGIPKTTLYSRCQAGTLGTKIQIRQLETHVWRISEKEIKALKAEKH